VPAADTIYESVKTALIKDGWTITHDPYRIEFGGQRTFVDLGAERILAAERGVERIAVEIKSFLGPSRIDDFEKAVGQFIVYQSHLKRIDPSRKLYLAIDRIVNDTFFAREAKTTAFPAWSFDFRTRRSNHGSSDPVSKVDFRFIC
jgi:hypothetical protein